MSTGAPERARWPRLAASPHPRLRGLLPRGYAGFTEATTPRHLVLPATSSVPMVVKLADSPRRPPAFVMGARGSYTVVMVTARRRIWSCGWTHWPPTGSWACP